ncbi:hypothetical protein, partial [Aeromonas sp.]|uniref:hypothetical protein n=1 Tax=Aeromonas sp. TaxID=647 RepID=UPI0025853149
LLLHLIPIGSLSLWERARVRAIPLIPDPSPLVFQVSGRREINISASDSNRPCYLTEAARVLPLLSQLIGYPSPAYRRGNLVAAYK